jgi:hypothetical protein
MAVEADRDQEREGRDGERAHDRPPPLDLPARAREALLSNSPLGTARGTSHHFGMGLALLAMP